MCTFLESEGVFSALIGGSALAVHGIARATFDTDLLVSDSRVLEAGLWERFAPQRPEIRRGDVDDPIEGLVRFEGPDASLDVILLRGSWVAPLVERRTWIVVDGERIAVVGVADLILLKLVAAGPQDLLDVRLLLAARPEARGEVEARIAKLPPHVHAAWTNLSES